MSLFKKTFSNLFKTRKKISETFKKVFKKDSLSDEDCCLIEETLLSADVSWKLTDKIIENIKNNYSSEKDWENLLANSLKDSLPEINEISINPAIIMIGVNGVGKTTACAKLANSYKNRGNSVILVAADTYRAAAVEQLELWAKTIKVNCISNLNTSDPASIAYDGINSGISNNIDYTLIDTAGRLHTSINLMNELQKVYKVISKVTDKITVIMNIDANLGQNSLSQIEKFNKILPIDGVILNKMDGTAKGGVVMSIMDKFKFPVLYFGIGEGIDDMIPFNLNDYIKSLISSEELNE